MRGYLRLLLLAGGVLAAQAATAEQLFVKIKSTQIRQRPQHYSAGIVSLREGDAVEALGSDAGWIKVRAGGKEGYLHESAVSSRQVKLRSDGIAGKGAQQSEVALAGKGFSPEVEKRFASERPSANFSAVDSMERLATPRAEVAKFIKDGRLGGEG